MIKAEPTLARRHRIKRRCNAPSRTLRSRTLPPACGLCRPPDHPRPAPHAEVGHRPHQQGGRSSRSSIASTLPSARPSRSRSGRPRAARPLGPGRHERRRQRLPWACRAADRAAGHHDLDAARHRRHRAPSWRGSVDARSAPCLRRGFCAWRARSRAAGRISATMPRGCCSAVWPPNATTIFARARRRQSRRRRSSAAWSAEIASRFGVVVSERSAASAMPVLGALGGATVNMMFMNHFQRIAQRPFRHPKPRAHVRAGRRAPALPGHGAAAAAETARGPCAWPSAKEGAQVLRVHRTHSPARPKSPMLLSIRGLPGCGGCERSRRFSWCR